VHGCDQRVRAGVLEMRIASAFNPRGRGGEPDVGRVTTMPRGIVSRDGLAEKESLPGTVPTVLRDDAR
jgi:hypothetical protein